MAVKYHLVLRKNMSKNVEAGKEKLYYGDVKLVLDRMNLFAAKALGRGEVVQFGELGNFQLLLGSRGSVTEDDFSSTLLKKPRLRFRPGSLLRNMTQTVKGERTTLTPTTPPAGGGEDDRPVIE